MTHTVYQLQKIFQSVAKSALFTWRQSDEGINDLVNDLWVWYMERPATQKKIGNADRAAAKSIAYRAAQQILSRQVLESNKFNGLNLYSSDNIKDALLGLSKNLYLVDILPRALAALDKKNPQQAEAIRSRYTDGVIPEKEGGAAMLLSRAVKSLTEHVNVIAITAGVDAHGNVKEGPGSRKAIFPELRRAKGSGHSDPTGDTAVLLLSNPVDEDGNSLRDEYLYESPIKEFLNGRSNA